MRVDTNLRMRGKKSHTVLRQSNPEFPVFDVCQVDGSERTKTLHRNELLRSTAFQWKSCKLKRRVAVADSGFIREFRHSVPQESESLASSFSDSSSGDEEHNREDDVATQRRPDRLPGDLDLRPRAPVRKPPPSRRPTRQKKPPGWLITGNSVTLV